MRRLESAIRHPRAQQQAGEGRGEARNEFQGPRAVEAYTLAPNKANLPRFGPENGDRAEKQSQSKPILRLNGLSRVRVAFSRPLGIGVYGTPDGFAPNKANLAVFGLETRVGRKNKANSPSRPSLVTGGAYSGRPMSLKGTSTCLLPRNTTMVCRLGRMRSIMPSRLNGMT